MKLYIHFFSLVLIAFFLQSSIQSKEFHLKISILDHYYYNISPSQNDELFCKIDSVYQGELFTKTDTIIVHLNDAKVDQYSDGSNLTIRFDQANISQIEMPVCKGFDAKNCWTMKHKYISISKNQLQK